VFMMLLRPEGLVPARRDLAGQALGRSRSPATPRGRGSESSGLGVAP
jgi:hypothetical protein